MDIVLDTHFEATFNTTSGRAVLADLLRVSMNANHEKRPADLVVYIMARLHRRYETGGGNA